jgi:hypothetical protein
MNEQHHEPGKDDRELEWETELFREKDAEIDDWASQFDPDELRKEQSQL